jgi:hypothetical protein
MRNVIICPGTEALYRFTIFKFNQTKAKLKFGTRRRMKSERTDYRRKT